MESKVKAIKISIGLIFLSTISTFILNFLIPTGVMQQYLYTIFSGILTSALVTMCIYIVEYNVCKKECMEEYFQEAIKVNNALSRIEYLEFDEPEELVMEYYNELENNNYIYKLMQDSIRENEEFMHLLCDEAEKEMVEYMRQEDSSIQKLYGINYSYECAKSMLDNKITKYSKMINDIISQYVELSNIDYSIVENEYGKLYFYSNRGRVYRDEMVKQNCNTIVEIIYVFWGIPP